MKMPFFASVIHRRTSGFTLVELLVVIGIIAVLIGILLPTLSKAREQAKGTMCAARMRDIGNCFASYLAENKGMGVFYGFTLSPAPSGFTGNYTQFWCFLQSTPTGATQSFDFTQGYMSKYFKKNEVLNCPSVEDFFPIQNITAPDAPPVSYGYNANGTFRTANARRFSAIRKPSETVALVDAAEARNNTLNYSYTCQLPNNRVPNFHGRHRGMGNVLWYDGHVTPTEPYMLSSSLHTAFLSVNYLAMKDVIVNAKLGVLVPFNKTEMPESQFTASMATTEGAARANYYFYVDKTLRR